MARKASIVEEAVSKFECAVGLALVIANDYEGMVHILCCMTMLCH